MTQVSSWKRGRREDSREFHRRLIRDYRHERIDVCQCDGSQAKAFGLDGFHRRAF